MAYRYLFIADLYEERNRETFLWEAVPERCLKWFPFIVLKWRKISEEISFLWKNRKYTWSDVQRLAITHSKYYLICENVHELSFLKTFWCCGLFKKNYQNSGWRWSGEGHMIEIDPATFLLPVAFHLHGQMFEQPGLCQQTHSWAHWTLGSAGMTPPLLVQSIAEWFWFQLDQLTSSLCFGKRFNSQWSPWGALERLSPPSPPSPPSSFLSWVLYSTILCLWIRLYI